MATLRLPPGVWVPLVCEHFISLILQVDLFSPRVQISACSGSQRLGSHAEFVSLYIYRVVKSEEKKSQVFCFPLLSELTKAKTSETPSVMPYPVVEML